MKPILSKRQKVAQIFFPAAFVHDSEENHQSLEELIRLEEVGGLTFFHSRISAAANFEKRQEVLDVEGTLEKLVELINRFQQASKTPLIISIDGEFGLAMRIENTPIYPYAISLGGISLEGEKQVEEVAYKMGLEMKTVGIHLNLAPCADVNTNPLNPVIGYRSYGSDTNHVARLALAAYKGLNRAGIGACLKHFPGHGDTQVDSHLNLPVVNKSKKELVEEELYPFQYGIDHDVEMIMVGHLAVPALSNGAEISASISREIITDLLKKEMGFQGIVISDALNMKAVSRLFDTPGQLEWEAFHAGNDILCFSENVKEGIDFILEKATEAEINASFEKLQDLKEKLGVFERRPAEVPKFNWESHEKFLEKLSREFLCEWKGEINPIKIRDLGESGNLGLRSFPTQTETVFSELLQEYFGRNLYEISDKKADRMIITLFVPSAKPVNHFGLENEVLEEIKQLALDKSCILYLFGNPLSLRLLGDLKRFSNIIVAYQNFEATQRTAIKHLMGEWKAIGKMSVKL
ncbi:glycoside hydrolase family 3 protein [Algoriphagus machipongonensis]|uniref:beta-N-acetylhexosaminidase n=1 Tax=Algoriphagus machipongonensis TaxID=388413 RepID=A3HZ06_9BACT|nr:glycoside hydrolase family 3 N-terminal domain-containing protein [Algoriphagus machipongonensis]EAZ80492.1 glycosyl hydrolase [Algoriphagus machipongonensis]